MGASKIKKGLTGIFFKVRLTLKIFQQSIGGIAYENDHKWKTR